MGLDLTDLNSGNTDNLGWLPYGALHASICPSLSIFVRERFLTLFPFLSLDC